MEKCVFLWVLLFLFSFFISFACGGNNRGAFITGIIRLSDGADPEGIEVIAECDEKVLLKMTTDKVGMFCGLLPVKKPTEIWLVFKKDGAIMTFPADDVIMAMPGEPIILDQCGLELARVRRAALP